MRALCVGRNVPVIFSRTASNKLVLYIFSKNLYCLYNQKIVLCNLLAQAFVMDFPFEQDILLENDRCLIRPLQADDLDNLLPAATANKNLVQYSPSPIYTKELLQQYIETALNERKNKLRYPFILFDKKANAYGGSSSYMNISGHDKRLEIGNTWIGPDFQRTGFNRNNKYLMFAFVFEQLEYERL